jgi:hypothetical protein
MDGIIIGGWSGISVLLIPTPNIFLTGVLFIHIANTVYKQVKGAEIKMKNNRGVAIVEFAIVLPLLAILLFGIIEFGFIIYNKAMITNASREGARIGIVYRIDSGNNYLPQTILQ